MEIDARAFGQLEGEVKALGDMLAEQRKTLEAQNKTLADLTMQLAGVSSTLSEARGGWRVLLAIGGAASGVTVALQWLIEHIKT